MNTYLTLLLLISVSGFINCLDNNLNLKYLREEAEEIETLMKVDLIDNVREINLKTVPEEASWTADEIITRNK